jgi:1,2-diacylglycerol 3-alpha-glucosyltransferase
MKILITSDWYKSAVNGVVTSVLNLQHELERRGHEVRILTLSNTRETYWDGNVLYLGSIDANKVYPGARLRSCLARHEIRELISWKPDVVHSQCEFSTFLLARQIANAVHAPLVHTYHTVYEDYTHYFSPSRECGRWLAEMFTRIVLGQTSCVVAPTGKVRELLMGYGINQPVYVIPTGIDLSRFTAPISAAQTDALKTRLGIPAHNHVLVYVGRLAKEKNIDTLLECCAGFEKDVTLLIVGGGPEQGRLEAKAKDLGISDQVIFAGMAAPEEVANYYRLGDIFVSASTSETQGLTYIEALASGLPAVCQADPCLSGVVENGSNGFQFHTAEELQREVSLLLQDEDLRRAMARAAAKSAQKFSSAEFARAAEHLYRAEVWRMGGDACPYTGEEIDAIC